MGSLFLSIFILLKTNALRNANDMKYYFKPFHGLVGHLCTKLSVEMEFLSFKFF